MPVAVISRRVEARVFTTLARVRPRPDTVHPDRQRLVCLRAECAQRHRGTHESRDDCARRLDLVQGHRIAGRQYLEEIPQGCWLWVRLRETVVFGPGVGLAVAEAL